MTNRQAMFVHPGQAYRLHYPEHWEHLEQDEGRSCGFGPRERDDVGLWITILPVSVDAERIEHDLPKIFAEAMADDACGNIRRDPALGHTALKADIRKDGEAGHFWMVAGGDLVLFASSQVPAAESRIWNPQLERVMASLEITREGELLRRRTADAVYRRLRALHPEQEYRLEEDGILGRDHRVSLANVYRQVDRSPERREEIVEHFVDGLAAMVADPPGDERLDRVRDHIFPVLKPVGYIKADNATGRLVRTPWLGEVVVCYAIRGEKASRLITDWDCERWSMDQEPLHSIAMTNLGALPWPERLEGASRAGGRLIILETNDDLEASRLLHPDLHRTLSGPLGSPFYAGIPNRETLVAFSAGNDDLFAHVLGQIRRDHDGSAYPITPEPFLVTARGVTLARM